MGRIRVIAALAGLTVVATAVEAQAASVPKTWVSSPAIASMATPRDQETATTLTSGKVLVTGGKNGGTVLSSAELYDPTTNTWSAAASMSAARTGHTATLLAPAACAGGSPPSYCGKVLVAGGGTTPEVYDPGANTWTSTGAFPAGDDPGSQFTATLLNPPACAGGSPPSYCGKVLVAGGDAGLGTNKALLYDPSASTWTATAQNMNHLRFDHSAVLLGSGKVLVAGGYKFNFSGLEATSEFYDPSADTWTATGNLPSDPAPLPAFTYGPIYATMTLLPGGQALLAGGQVCSNTSCSQTAVSARAAVYDPAGGTWAFTTSMTVGRARHRADLLGDGTVLVEGGLASLPLLSETQTAETYHLLSASPLVGLWTPVGPMSVARLQHASAVLSSGAVLVVGGIALTPDPLFVLGGGLGVVSADDTSSAEVYTP